MPTPFPGKPLVMGPRTFSVPMSSIRINKLYRGPAAKLMQDLAAGTSGDLSEAGTKLDDLFTDAAFEVLRRNYPDLARDEFDELFDMDGVNRVLALSATPPSADEGNAAASQSTGSIGTPSLHESSTSPVGDGPT
ncbi:hypothetical protein GCM10007242_45470 [Pigmentiphaga litoralis]|uniref:hypothetical protein n=1 Tax=Pigmentiphaga litoralis TaxID=516702 RepID=UPI001671DCA9|nr:hypothetical protein [Pigmentiphaga litoralis]GGX33240.1 hypothetical protein GCM10007242_45470 [Pigmentiphaga litoralis]